MIHVLPTNDSGEHVKRARWEMSLAEFIIGVLIGMGAATVAIGLGYHFHPLYYTP